ncbi:hypothetical protein AB3S75_042093 [Citrus x aurantiifolia]
MKVLSWNVRGLGNPRTRLELKKILQMHRPQILFLCETKLRSGQINKECRNLNFENGFGVGRDGMSGGVTMFWDADVQVEITSYSNHHIDAVVSKWKWQEMEVHGSLWTP